MLCVIYGDRGLSELIDELYCPLEETLRARIGSGTDYQLRVRCTVCHALYRYLEDRGRQYGWHYADLEQMAFELLPGLMAKAKGSPVNEEAFQSLAEFCRQYDQLSHMDGPFYGCDACCNGTCLHRYAVAHITQRDDLQTRFRDSVRDSWDPGNWHELCTYVIDQILMPGVDERFSRQAGVCFVIQQAAAWTELDRDNRRRLVDDTMAHFETGMVDQTEQNG